MSKNAEPKCRRTAISIRVSDEDAFRIHKKGTDLIVEDEYYGNNPVSIFERNIPFLNELLVMELEERYEYEDVELVWGNTRVKLMHDVSYFGEDASVIKLFNGRNKIAEHFYDLDGEPLDERGELCTGDELSMKNYLFAFIEESLEWLVNL